MKGWILRTKKKMAEENWKLEDAMVFYRYAALVIISIFYLVGFKRVDMSFKILIISGLFIEAYVFNRVYDRYKGRMQRQKLLLFGEVGLLSVILFITGGLNSPVLGYMISPLLLASAMKPPYFSWLLLSFLITWTYFLNGFLLAAIPNYRQFSWLETGYFIAILILITLGGQVYYQLIDKLSDRTEKLERYISHINALYDSVEIFTHHRDPQEIINLFVACGKRLTRGDKIILWVMMPPVNKSPSRPLYYGVRGAKNIMKEENWYPEIIRYMDENWKTKKYDLVDMNPIGDTKGQLLTVKIQSKSNFYGIFSVFYRDKKETDQNIQTLLFLSKLCGEVLDKHRLESTAMDFLVAEEKDRIAGEIHDQVTQNLFGLVYGLDELVKSPELPWEINDRLRLMQKTAQRCIKELRHSIYAISSRKNDREPFVLESRRYLQDLGTLNRVAVSFEVEEPIGLLDAEIKKGLYRVLREATGNAIRHSQCDRIEVHLKAKDQFIEMVIRDNGKGFQYPLRKTEKNHGLGLLNMQEITRNLQGDFMVHSEREKGTEIQCRIPLQKFGGILERGEGR